MLLICCLYRHLALSKMANSLKIFTTKTQTKVSVGKYIQLRIKTVVFFFICFFFSFRAPKNLELKKRQHLKHQQGITTSVREYKRHSVHHSVQNTQHLDNSSNTWKFGGFRQPSKDWTKAWPNYHLMFRSHIIPPATDPSVLIPTVTVVNNLKPTSCTLDIYNNRPKAWPNSKLHSPLIL